MPERRLAKARATLPAGYRFGDSRLPLTLCSRWDHMHTPEAGCWETRWRPAHENAADRLARYQTEYESREGDTSALTE